MSAPQTFSVRNAAVPDRHHFSNCTQKILSFNGAYKKHWDSQGCIRLFALTFKICTCLTNHMIFRKDHLFIASQGIRAFEPCTCITATPHTDTITVCVGWRLLWFPGECTDCCSSCHRVQAVAPPACYSNSQNNFSVGHTSLHCNLC